MPANLESLEGLVAKRLVTVGRSEPNFGDYVALAREFAFGIGSAVHLRERWGQGSVSHDVLMSVYRREGKTVRESALMTSVVVGLGAVTAVSSPASAFVLVAGAGGLLGSYAYAALRRRAVMRPAVKVAEAFGKLEDNELHHGFARVARDGLEIQMPYMSRLDPLRAQAEENLEKCTGRVAQLEAEHPKLVCRFIQAGDAYRMPNDCSRRFNLWRLPKVLPKMMPQDVRGKRKELGLA